MARAERGDAGWERLKYLVAQPYIETVTTKGGIVKPKTRKQVEIEKEVANEVVRFAYDHGGYQLGFLAPGGLWMALADEAGVIKY